MALSLVAGGVSVAITGRNEDTMKGTWADVPMFIGAHDFEDLMLIIQ